MHGPVTVILSQPVSMVSIAQSQTLFQQYIPLASVIVSAIGVFATYLVARMQKKTQDSLKDIQSRKLSLDLFERRMEIYRIVKSTIMSANSNSLTDEKLVLFWNAFYDSHFIFEEKLVQYLLEVGNNLFEFQMVNVLMAANKQNANVDLVILKNLTDKQLQLREWFADQQVLKDKSSVIPLVTQKFKEFIDFSKL